MKEKELHSSGDRYIYGRNAVIEALKAGNEIEKIFVIHGIKGKNVDQIFSSAKRQGIYISIQDRRKFVVTEEKAGADKTKSQGVVALLKNVKTISLPELVKIANNKEDRPVIIALDEITDPQNLGAIARSAECSGAAGLLMAERNAAPLSSVAVKASAGALEHLPVCRVGNLARALEELKDKGFWVLGTDMDAENTYDDNVYDRPVVIIIGSEGKGMRPVIRKQCDYFIRIPLHGKISSLNASVSAAIVLFEIRRQRK